MSKGADKQTTTSSSLQTQTGWEPAMEMLQGQVMPLLGQAGQTPLSYAGPSYIGPTGLQQQGTQQQQAYLQGAGQQGVNQALGAWQGALNPGSFMNAPGAYAPLDAYAQNAQRAYSENFAPSLRDQAYAHGQGGGYSSERAQADALERARIAESIGQQSAGLTGSLWNQGLNARNAAIGQAPAMFNLGGMPGQGLYQLGGQNRDELYQRQQMGNQAAQFAQMEPWRRSQMLGSQLGSYAGLGGTVDASGTQETATKKASDPLGTAASIGMMAFGLATGNPMAVMGGMSGLGGGGGGGGGGGQAPGYGSGQPLFGWGAPAPAAAAPPPVAAPSYFDRYAGL